MTKINWFLALSLLASTTAFAGSESASDRLKCKAGQPGPAAARVDRVVDGDTVIIRVAEGTYSVRMLGIDTPETHFMGKSQGEWGDKAAELLTDILPVGTNVRLEYSDEGCDGHGRLLAHVFNGRTHTNAEMTKQGLAANYCVAPSFKYCREIGDNVANAIQNRIGMFSDSNAELPYDFRRRIGGNEQRSYVGNLRTKEVLPPGHQDEIPVAERVFFYRKSDVKPPFRVIEDKI